MKKGPEGRYIFGLAKVGERGQVVIPKEARDIFEINPGDNLLVVGDIKQGLALLKSGEFADFALRIFNSDRSDKEEDE